MRDRRSVEDLSIEELEQILRLKKHQQRQERLERYERQGRRRVDVPLPGDEPAPEPEVQRGIVYTSLFGNGAGDSQSKNRDRLLLGIEVAAALGLVAILIFAAVTLRDLNRQSVEAQAEQIAALPSPTPTPLISAVVLPGGHTPPTSDQGAAPNYDEVPSHLRPLVEQQYAGPVIIPTPSPGSAIRIRIPAINVDAPIVQGDGWEQLQKGVGQHIGSALPGAVGNVVLSAHNDIYGEIFRRLDQLQEGDEIILHTQTQQYTYRVDHWRIVDPTDVGVMDPTHDPVVTLISCYPYLVNTDRIVVIAGLSQ
jgi:sortase A